MHNSRGQGSIFYNKARDNWTVLYYETDAKTGIRKRKSKSQPTKEMAERFFTSIIYQQKNPLYIKKHKICLGDFMKLRTKTKLETNIISENSLGRINQTLNVIKKSYLYNKKIDEITTEEIQCFLNTLTDYSNSTIKKIYSEFNQIFNYAFSQNLILANPMADIIKPKSKIVNKPLKALTIEEQEYMAKYLMSLSLKKCRYKNVFLIQMFTGMRIGEVLALKITDIDLAHSIINVERTISKNKNSKVILGKTTKTYAGTRQLPIPKFLRGYIMEQMKIVKQSGYNVKLLFRNSLGNIANPAQVNTAFKETIKSLGFTDVTSHTLRHTFATRCIEGGMKPVVLQRLMGHTNIQITLNTYTSVFNKYKESEITKVNNYYLDNNIISYAQKEICDYSVVCMKNEE